MLFRMLPSLTVCIHKQPFCCYNSKKRKRVCLQQLCRKFGEEFLKNKPVVFHQLQEYLQRSISVLVWILSSFTNLITKGKKQKTTFKNLSSVQTVTEHHAQEIFFSCISLSQYKKLHACQSSSQKYYQRQHWWVTGKSLPGFLCDFVILCQFFLKK